MNFLHPFNVKIKRACEGIRDLSGAEGFHEFSDGIFDREAGRETEFAEDFFRGNMVGTVVVRGRVGDFDVRANDVADFLGDGVEGEVLVASVEDLAIDLRGRQGEAFHIKFRAIADMEVRAELGAAEDRDLAFVDGMVGQDVDREVEAQARRPSADGRGTERERGEAGRAAFFEFVLAHGFEAGVVGERFARQVFGDILLLLHAIDAGGRGVDESADAAVLSDIDKRQEGFVIDRAAKGWIELEAGVVRDAGEMNDGIAARQRFFEERGIAQISFEEFQIQAMGGNDAVEDLLAVNEEIEDADFIAGFEQQRDEHGADIAASAGDEDGVEIGIFHERILKDGKACEVGINSFRRG